MPRHRKVDHYVAEMWISMMTTGALVTPWSFSNLIGAPHESFKDLLWEIDTELRRVGTIMRSPAMDHREKWRFDVDNAHEVMLVLQRLQARHIARGYKRRGWSTLKLTRATDALEYAVTLVMLGASGNDIVKTHARTDYDWNGNRLPVYQAVDRKVG